MRVEKVDKHKKSVFWVNPIPSRTQRSQTLSLLRVKRRGSKGEKRSAGLSWRRRRRRRRRRRALGGGGGGRRRALLVVQEEDSIIERVQIKNKARKV